MYLSNIISLLCVSFDGDYSRVGKYFKVGFEFFAFRKWNLENLLALLTEHEFVYRG